MKKAIWLYLFLISSLYSQNAPVVHILTLDGVINPAASDYIQSGIQQAEKENSQCLIIEMDTPGGLMQSMQQIVKNIMASPVPVVVYVAPSGSRAGSAGVFITYAANFAAMAPGTNIGAAHPVTMNSGQDSSSTMMEKVTNDAVAFIKSIAEKRGRNEEWAEKAVRESASIPASEALKLHVIDVIADNVDSLLNWLNGRQVETAAGTRVLDTQNARKVKIEMSFRFKILDIISDPNIAYILMLIGIYGIFFELYNPGSILPGVIGGICIILFFYSMHTLPVDYAGLLLILFAIILFIAEIKIPSYGLLSVGGVVSFVLGSIMLFRGPMPYLQVSWKIIVFATIVTTLFFLFAVGMGIRAQRRKSTTGREGIVGEKGSALENFVKGKGQIAVHGEIWHAESTESIHKDDSVEVVSIEGLKIMVKKI